MNINQIKIDPEKCLGCGGCMAVAPGTFTLGDDMKAQVINPPTDDVETIRTAAENCPTGGIEVSD